MNTNLIDLEAVIGQANALTALPQSTVRLAGLVEAKQDSVAEVVEVVAFDPGLTFKLIRTANSAFSGSSQPVTTVHEAVSRLGTKQTFALAVASSVRPHMQQNLPQYGFTEGEFWRHSIAAAVATEVMQPCCECAIPTEAFTAALMHDIGKLIMARTLSPDILMLLKQARLEGRLTPLEAEAKVLKVHHGELGGIIAQHWKFAERIVRGIIYHHNPEDGGDPICDVVYLANLAAKQIQTGQHDKKPDIMPHEDALQRLGFQPNGFEKLCAEGLQRFEQVKSRYNVS